MSDPCSKKKCITKNSEVLIHFSIRLADGSAVDSSKVENKPAKFVIGDGSLSAGFEAVLLGLKEGEEKTFTLPPESTFGLSNPDNIHHVELSKFNNDIPAEVGAIISFGQADGSELLGVVREIAGESVTMDFNHPLAGQTLTFDVEVLEILK